MATEQMDPERLKSFEKWEESQKTKKGKNRAKRMATTAIVKRYDVLFKKMVKYANDNPEAANIPASVT